MPAIERIGHAAEHATDDAVSRLLAPCRSLEDFLEATKGILPEDEVRGRFAAAANFGQLRMVIGNRMRGEIAWARSAMRQRGRA
jgi:hypothetical protein